MENGICMAESLCCSPESITTLLISYIPQYKITSLKEKKKQTKNEISEFHMKFSVIKLMAQW